MPWKVRGQCVRHVQRSVADPICKDVMDQHRGCIEWHADGCGGDLAGHVDAEIVYVQVFTGAFGGSGDSRQLEPICLREISETSPVVFGGVLCSVLGSFEAEVRRARALDSVFVPGAAGQDFRTCCCSSNGSRVAMLQAVRSCFLGTFVL
jgi:hypothetical protein